jgi:aminopeptidase N
MEYPTLVMTVPLERAVVHELAHQWWYGLVGDDPWTAPWLDEGFASYAEQTLLGTLAATCQATPWPSDAARITLGMDWWREHPRQYAPTVYSRGACALGALRERLGPHRFDTMLRAYADAHRFGFSTVADFKAAAEAAAAQTKPPIDLAPFWREQRID